MKKLAFLIISSLLLSSPILAQEKRISPPKSTENTIGDLNIKIDYSSPSVKGRTIFGTLEPWGKVWRAGANEATTMEFSKDVTINGKELPKGKYAFFVIPRENGKWTLIFNEEEDQWGAYKYDESKDALRIEVSPETIDHQEQLIYRISDEGKVYLDWSTTRVGFQIK